MKEKICIVAQRYGLEVNGGAELLCRQFAERLVNYYDVDVITTKAIDYLLWKNEYKEDQQIINKVNIKRFKTTRQRSRRFNRINIEELCQETEPLKNQKKWVEKQGPYAPELLKYLKENYSEYKKFVFFTYLYYPTIFGVPIVKEKAILVPFAHDEIFLNMKIYKQLFEEPKAILYSTEEEKKLIEEKFANYDIPSKIGGAGIDLPDNIDGEELKKQNGLNDYIVYIGRIDYGKDCDKLFRDFLKYKERNHNNLKLLLIGKEFIEVPKSESIISLGFVSDKDKFNAIAGAKALILPSKFESLSMVVLEAMKLKTPVIVNGECEVTKAHCVKSNAGLYYNNYNEFEGIINYVNSNPNICKQMGDNGYKYIRENYDWNKIILNLKELIEL